MNRQVREPTGPNRSRTRTEPHGPGPGPGPNHLVRDQLVLVGGSLNTGKLVWSTTTDNYCVAQFFIYHALDINK